MKGVLFSIILILILLPSCKLENPINSEPTSTGSLTLKIDHQNKPDNVVLLKAILSRPQFSTLIQQMNLMSDSTADVLFSQIAVGKWHLLINAYDASGSVKYSGETEVNIQDGITLQVNLTLNPTGNGYGNVHITVNWGSLEHSWEILRSDTSTDLNTVFFINTSTGWAGGSNGRIIKTSDGGTTWTTQQTSTTQRINWIYFLNEKDGFAVGENGTFLKTISGGRSWIPVDIFTRSSLYYIHFNGLNGWAVGTEGTLLRTTDGGISWQLASFGSGYSALSVYFKDPLNGWIVGISGLILKTTDGGLSWIDSGSSSSWGWLQTIKGINENILLAVAGRGIIIRSTNNGDTWYHINSNSTEHFEDVCFVSNSTGWIVGNHGTILKTQDGGQSWTKEIKVTDNWLIAVYFLNENEGWAVGNRGTILKYSK